MTIPSGQENDVEELTGESTGTGWLLPMSGDLTAAVGESEMIYVFPFEPEVFTIPNTPSYARGVIVWRKRLVPLIDVNTYLRPGDAAVSRETVKPEPTYDDSSEQQLRVGETAIDEFVALFAFRSTRQADGDFDLGALLLNDVPERVVVADDQACELPDNLSSWDEMAVSCFSHEKHGAVPILDLAVLFSAAARRTESTSQTLV